MLPANVSVENFLLIICNHVQVMEGCDYLKRSRQH
jgi:hypothetical protein